MQSALMDAHDREVDAREGVGPDVSLLGVTLPAAPGSDAARLGGLSAQVRVSYDFFQNAVNAAWLLSLRGEPVDPESIVRVAPNFFRVEQLDVLGSVLSSEKMRLALLSRGIDPGRVRADGLTPEMVACIRAVTDPTLGLTLRQRLRGAGVSWAQYQGWQGFSVFREALTAASEGGLKSNVAAANTALGELVDAKDLKAIQYLHELTGYFTPGKQQNLDTQDLITQMMSAVLRRVRDPEVLLALAGDFRVLQEQMSLTVGAGAPGSGEPGALMLGFGERPLELEVELDVEGDLPSS